MIIGIYKISLNGSVVYVGQSRNVDRRISTHKLYMRNNDTRHENRYLCNAAQKYGIESFEFELIEEVESIDDLTKREQFWIRELGYPKGNYMIPKDGDNWSVSDEFIEKYLKGEKNPNYGNKWSDQQKQEASKRMAGRYDGEKNPNYGNWGEKNPLTKHICPYKTPEELKAKLREVGGFCALAKELGISRSIVQNWCTHMGVPYKRRDYEDFGVKEPPITKEEFIEMNSKMSYSAMARHFGVNRYHIEIWRDRLGVEKKFIKRKWGDAKCQEE